MAVYLSPVYGSGAALLTSQGVVLNGGSIEFYQAGTTTPLAAYTDHTGATPIGVTMTLGSDGRTSSQIWLSGGQPYKFVVKNSAGVVQTNLGGDWISGVNDPSGGAPANSEWIAGPTPTYISPTSFSMAGNQTALFPVGQRIRYTVTAGTGYGTVTSSVFGAVTTIGVQVDSIPLDNGMSVVAYGLLNAAAPSISAQGVAYSSTAADTTVPSVGNTLKRVDRAVALTTTTGGTTAFVLTPAVPLASYATNAPLLVKFNATSTGSPTLNVSGLGALNLKQINSVGTKVAASFAAGQIAQVIYDGVDLVVMLQTAGGRLLRIITITANGTYTPTSDARSALIRGVGGGGGVAAVPAGCGGAGAGGYFEKFIATLAASYTIGIGAGGSLAGGNGGNTTFDVLCTGNGGTGNAGTTAGSLGGTATGGDINISGGGGSFGGSWSANVYFGMGGSSFYGGAGIGQLNNATGAVGATNSGGGASGGTATGAIGGSGRVDVYEYS